MRFKMYLILQVMLHRDQEEDENVRYQFISYMIYYPLVIIMFVLNCFADLPPRDTPYKFDKVSQRYWPHAGEKKERSTDY